MLAGLLIRFGAAWLKLAQSLLPVHAMANEWIVALVACVFIFNLIGKLLDARERTTH
jgi:hypothetical protein